MAATSSLAEPQRKRIEQTIEYGDFDGVEEVLDAMGLSDRYREHVATILEAHTDSSAESTGSADDSDSDTTLDEEVQAAFTAAIEHFHEQIDREIADHTEAGEHPDRPTTAREYYRNRGWTEETIRRGRFGWAPADQNLLSHLRDEGFSQDAILGTGFFTVFDDGTISQTWAGRYVLPYFDADGRQPVYAISRCTGKVGGGKAGYDGHTEDFIAGKYGKLSHAKEYAQVDEPIFGRHTVEPGEPLLVAGGIADAISLHQAGYPCISPVTTVRFKGAHEQTVVDLVEANDIPAVYIVNDAERPSIDRREIDGEPEQITDVLTIEQYGEGLRGAFGDAQFLTEAGIETRLVTLPRLNRSLRKADPDDYLHDNWGALETVLASAKPAEEHPGYCDWRERRRTPTDGRTTPAPDRDDGTPDSGASALYDLDIRDVTGLPWDFRGKNPLGHHASEGGSENYFVLLKEYGTAYDHKYGATYNALTYLLCEAGARADKWPSGTLNDREILDAWIHAKRQRYIPTDDPIPRRAVVALAIQNDLCDRDEVADGWKLPANVFNDALEACPVEPGREPLTRGEFSLVLPITELNDAIGELPEDDVPTTGSIHDRIEDESFRSLHDANQTLLSTPTGTGKTYTLATIPFLEVHTRVTGGQPVIHTHATTEARSAAAEDSRANGVSVAEIKNRTETCPVAGGKHDPDDAEKADRQPITIDGMAASDWFDMMCDGRGMPFSMAHERADRENDQGVNLPCCPAVDGREDAGRYECPSQTQWNGVPRTEDGDVTVDIVHTTHHMLHVPSLRLKTNILIDEQPEFGAGFSHDRVRRMVTAVLEYAGTSIETFEDLVTLDESEANVLGDVILTLEETAITSRWVFENNDAHAHAVPMAKAICKAVLGGPDKNGRRRGEIEFSPMRFDEDAREESAWNTEILTVVINEQNEIVSVRQRPDLSLARSVIGLDARPYVDQWRLNTGMDGLQTRGDVNYLLPTDARAKWRRQERGLTVVQIGDARRPAGQDGKHYNVEKSNVVIETAATACEELGRTLRTGLCPKSVEDDVEDQLADASDEDATVMHYGEELSRNDFVGEDAGAVMACIDPGDNPILNTLAELGADAVPERTDTDCGDCDGEGCWKCDGTGKVRAYGRGFDGPDADTADRILNGITQRRVSQAIGRYARDPNDPDDDALVFVWTTAIPDDLVDYHVPGVQRRGEKQQAILNVVVEHGPVTAREIQNRTDVNKMHIMNTLNAEEDNGTVEKSVGTGPYNADEWFSDGTKTETPEAWRTKLHDMRSNDDC